MGLEEEWKELGLQLASLTKESYRSTRHGGMKCLHCGICGPVRERDTGLIEHTESCEVGKAQELIAKIRKRFKKKGES